MKTRDGLYHGSIEARRFLPVLARTCHGKGSDLKGRIGNAEESNQAWVTASRGFDLDMAAKAFGFLP